MADVLPFFQGAAFDDDATQVMGKAFDRASQTLHDNGQPDLVRQIIAKRIIEVARNGERDPDELCARALQALAFVFAKSLDRAPPQFGAAARGSLARLPRACDAMRRRPWTPHRPRAEPRARAPAAIGRSCRRPLRTATVMRPGNRTRPDARRWPEAPPRGPRAP